MTKLVVSVEEAVLEGARAYATGRETTLDAMVSDFLKRIAKEGEKRSDARKRLLDLIDNSPAEVGKGFVWNREELYAGRMPPRHEYPDLRRGGEEG